MPSPRSTAQKRNVRGTIPDTNETIDLFLALDRALVEFSMKVYNVSTVDRCAMRAQNRRLHRAVRNSFPALHR